MAHQLGHRCGTFLLLIQSNLIENRFPTSFHFRASNSDWDGKAYEWMANKKTDMGEAKKRLRFALVNAVELCVIGSTMI